MKGCYSYCRQQLSEIKKKLYKQNHLRQNYGSLLSSVFKVEFQTCKDTSVSFPELLDKQTLQTYCSDCTYNILIYNLDHTCMYKNQVFKEILISMQVKHTISSTISCMLLTIINY